MRLERIQSPIGEALLVTDAEGARELRGYAGGLDRKRWLLAHEGVSVPAHQESLF